MPPGSRDVEPRTDSAEGKGLRQRIKWLIVLRIAIAAALAVATLLVRPGGEPGLFGPSFRAVLAVTLSHVTVAIAFGLLFRFFRVARLNAFAFVQIVWDLLFTTGLVYISGGIESELKFLYWFTIVNAAVLLFRKGAFAAAALSAILYGTLLDLEYFRIIPRFFESPDDTAWLERNVIASIVLNTFVFFAFAYVFSHVSVLLRQTERALAEKSVDLEDLEAFMGRIVDSLTSGLVTLDAKGRIGFWSRAAEEITGVAQAEVRGKPFRELFPDAPETFGSEPFGPNAPRPWRWESRFGRDGRGGKILGFSVSPLRAEGPGRQGSLILFQDLTSYREMEEQVKRADRMAAIGELAARIAHEIRNPLTSISGAIEVLGGQLRLGGQEQKLMAIVLRETGRLNQLLTDFLLFARPSAPQFEEVGMDRLVRETAELFSKSHAERRSEVSLRLAPGIVTKGDPRRLSQMLWNLFKNAQEAMGGSGVIRVALRKDEGSGEALIDVADEGGGIPADLRERIFSPFVTSKSRGTGLGLAMVRRIVDEHGGKISVESRAGKGTTFRVRLPLLGAGPVLAAGRV